MLKIDDREVLASGSVLLAPGDRRVSIEIPNAGPLDIKIEADSSATPQARTTAGGFLRSRPTIYLVNFDNVLGTAISGSVLMEGGQYVNYTLVVHSVGSQPAVNRLLSYTVTQL